jgi:hypothetical protein
MTYMFFPAEAAVVNLRRKEAILELEFGNEEQAEKSIFKKDHVMKRRPCGF